MTRPQQLAFDFAPRRGTPDLSRLSPTEFAQQMLNLEIPAYMRRILEELAVPRDLIGAESRRAIALGRRMPTRTWDILSTWEQWLEETREP